MSRAAVWLSASLLLAAAALAHNWRLPRPLQEPDEAAWIFSSYYYRLAFIDRDLRSPAWRDVDALDHPPLAKLYFGAFLAPGGFVAHSLNAKQWWFAMAVQPEKAEDFVAQLRALIPPGALRAARLASSLAVFALCALTAAVSACVFDAETGALACLLLVLMPLTRLVAGQAVADGPFAAVLTATVLVQALQARRLKRDGKASSAWTLASGAAIGLLVAAKISGAAALPLLYAWLGAGTSRRFWSARAAVLCAAATTIVAAATLFVVDPSLYRAPVSFLAEMYRYRWRAVQLQSVIFATQFHQTLLDQACGFLRGLFFAADKPSLATGALTAALAVAGLAWDAPALADEPETLTLAVLAFGWMGAAFLTFKIAWLRYLLPALPFVCLLAARGAWRLRRDRAWPRHFAAAALVAAALSWPARRFTIDRYYEAHPDVFAAKYRAAKAYLALHVPPAR